MRMRAMYKETVVTFLLLGSLVNICLCNDLYSDKVLKYDSETFKKNIGGNIPHFVNFFAPWCGYCKRLKPVWDELAEKYNKDSSKKEIIIAQVDCTAETPICAEEDVSGYPSLIFYKASEKKGIKYQGKRDLLGLEDFISNSLKEVEEKSVPSVGTKMTSESGALQLTDENFHETIDYGAHFVKFYAPWCGHCQKMAGTWEELAETMRHDKSVKISKVDCTVNKIACTEFEVKGFPTLIFIVNGKKVQKYQGDRNLESFKQFISEMKAAHNDAVESEEGRIPESDSEQANVVVELSADNFEDAIAQGFSFVKFYVPWCGHSKRLAPIWNDLGKKFVLHSRIKIAKVDCTQDEVLCSEHKVVGYPTLFIYRNGKFITEYHGPRKLEQLHSFVLEHLHHTEL